MNPTFVENPQHTEATRPGFRNPDFLRLVVNAPETQLDSVNTGTSSEVDRSLNIAAPAQSRTADVVRIPKNPFDEETDVSQDIELWRELSDAA